MTRNLTVDELHFYVVVNNLADDGLRISVDDTNVSSSNATLNIPYVVNGEFESVAFFGPVDRVEIGHSSPSVPRTAPETLSSDSCAGSSGVPSGTNALIIPQ